MEKNGDVISYYRVDNDSNDDINVYLEPIGESRILKSEETVTLRVCSHCAMKDFDPTVVISHRKDSIVLWDGKFVEIDWTGPNAPKPTLKELRGE